MASNQTDRNVEQNNKTTTDAATTSSRTSQMESSTNFQDDVRKWFTEISADERAAALGFFAENPMMALFACSSSTISASSTNNIVTTKTAPFNSSGDLDICNSRAPIRMAGKLEIPCCCCYCFKRLHPTMPTEGSEYYDWEARIALKIIEKTWEEIMMVGIPNTSGVNQKEFVKNSLELDRVRIPVVDSVTTNNDGMITKMEDRNNEKNIRKEKTKPDDGNNETSDAYRIHNEVNDAEGAPTSDIVNEPGKVVADIDIDTDTVDIKSTSETGMEGQVSDVGLGVNKLGSVSRQESTVATLMTSAKHGIEANLQFPSKKTSRRVAEVIMDNTCCIFPSATKIATTTIGGYTSHDREQKQQPFITIYPSYLKSISGEDLLFAFDEIIAMACANDGYELPSFILPDSTSDSWMELIHSYATDATKKPTTTKKLNTTLDPDSSHECLSSTTSLSIPLYLLVMSHFQLSLVKSYSAQKAIVLSSESSSSSNNNNIKKEIEKRTIMSKESNKPKGDNQSNWLPLFMNRIRELKKTEPTLVEKVLSKLSLKFPETEIFGESNVDNKCNLEGYLLLPLTMVAGCLGSRNMNNIKDRSDLLNSIDSSIGESLPNDWLVFKDGQSSKTNSKNTQLPAHMSMKNGVGDQFVVDNSTPVDVDDCGKIVTKPTSNVTCSKKSKKKKKKKKKNTAAVSVITKAKIEEKPDTDKKRVETSLENLAKTSGVKKVEIEGSEKEEEPLSTVDVVVSELNPVIPNVSFDCKKSTITSFDSFEENTKTEMTDKSEVLRGNELHSYKRDSVTSVVLAKPETLKEEVDKPKNEGRMGDESSNKADDQEDQWETVEARPRGRKKISEKGGNFNTGNTNGQQIANCKKKVSRSSRRDRNKYLSRRIGKDIPGGVLDAAGDDQLQRRRQFSREKTHSRRNQMTLSSTNSNSEVPANKSSIATLAQNSKTQQKKGGFIRDVLVGVKGSNSKQHSQKTKLAKAAPISYSERAKSLIKLDSNEAPINISGRNRFKKNENSNQTTGTKALKVTRTLLADQNTIPTIASTNSAFTSSITNVTQRKSGFVRRSDSSTTESIQAQKPKNAASDPVKYATPPPPLPTLLSPGNNNSTSSSVASSLDAPHSGHHGNASRQSENDVGCHLLDVCDRLSNEISEFMKRREAALAIRRHERGLVLIALEKTLGLIWPGMPTVEMYGSCATNLDLPSSDLDVVVCGLDRPLEAIPSPSNSASVGSKSVGESSMVEDDTQKEVGLPKVGSHQNLSPYGSDQRYSPHQMSHHHMQMMYGHMSVNAERVLRLAMELEHQPWAVHVKAIPTASVPVIKILADPARLQGAIMNGKADWLVQQPIKGKSSASMPSRVLGDDDSHPENQAPMSHYSSQQSSPLWRGADVVNGLLKVDITFEGPEHGGIWSTVFSKQVVQDFSNETGLSPECTPHVQVLMVLKELLAQRRLNEPFSGGLSSYALLLLVISMIGERSIIREELEKTELQRRVVAGGGGNSALRSSPLDSTQSEVTEGRKELSEKSQKKVTQTKDEDTGPKNTQLASHGKEDRIDATKLRNFLSAKTSGKSQESSENIKWKRKLGKPEQFKTTKKAVAVLSPIATSRKASVPSSWASVARKSASTPNLPPLEVNEDNLEKVNSESNKTKHSSDAASTNDRKVSGKPGSFADAVTKGKPVPVVHVTSFPKKTTSVSRKDEEKKRLEEKQIGTTSSMRHQFSSVNGSIKNDTDEPTKSQPKENVATSKQAKVPNSVHSSSLKQSKVTSTPMTDTSSFPQGFHDVIEVLCSGETTPGKLLMHFLLFYGQHFESQSTAIDYSGTHQRDAVAINGYSIRSSYLQRRNAGSYDPVTGMLTVDPIVVYDPLEGAENNNVARSCFAWSSIRWVFAQSYMTLSSAAEMNATTSEGTRNRATSSAGGEGPTYRRDESGHVVVDPSSPLLELLLSF